MPNWSEGARHVVGRVALRLCPVIFGLGGWLAMGGVVLAQGPGDVAATEVTSTIELFDGTSLDGLYVWSKEYGFSDPKGVFKVENGMIRVAGDQPYVALSTQTAYRNYVVILEFKWGSETYGKRKGQARDAGLLLHAQGRDGEWHGQLMPNIEAQIMEGAMGDLMVLKGNSPMSFTSTITRQPSITDSLYYRGGYRWSPTGRSQTFTNDLGTVHWLKWDPAWTNVAGYRGANDVENPLGQWNQMVVVADGDRLEVYFNGEKVNEATGVHPNSGKVQLESEQAEYYVRRWELRPLEASGGGSGDAALPAILAAPASQVVTPGDDVSLFVTAASSEGVVTYQWRKNGSAITGATASSLVLKDVTGSDTGSYTVTVTNAAGSLTSDAALLSVSPAMAGPGRLINLSTRAGVGSGDRTLIMGFVVGGPVPNGSQSLLIRGAGPLLQQFGVSAHEDPALAVYDHGGTIMATNDNWGGDGEVASAGASVGATPFGNADSKDAALVRSFAPGAYTVHVTGAGGGIALAEIFDAMTGAGATAESPRLINASSRSYVGTGHDILIVGFVIGGTSPVTVMIRAIGPSLAAYGVGDALANPTLTLYAGSTSLQSNDDWGAAANAAQIATTAAQIGAFALAAGSRDAVILTTLTPGVYTAHVSGVGGEAGVALAEIYAVP